MEGSCECDCAITRCEKERERAKKLADRRNKGPRAKWTQSEREEKNAIKIKMQKMSMEHGGWQHSGTGWQKGKKQKHGYKMWPAENGRMRFVSKPSKSRVKRVSDISLPWFHSTALLNDALWGMSANDIWTGPYTALSHSIPTHTQSAL